MYKRNLSTALKSRKKDIIQNFTIIFLLLSLLGFIIFSIFKYNHIKSERIILEKAQKNLVSLQNNIIGTSFYSITSDLKYLTSQYYIHNNLLNPNELNILANEWLNFAKNQKIYDQIRLIDENGNEKIRINYDNGNPQIIPKSELQNKQHRYYFKETIKLGKGQMFISKFDLNIEHSVIEKPLKPMIRFATPIFNNNGERKGIIIINYLGKYIINQFNYISENTDGQTFLLNPDSYWLFNSNDINKEWGFMFNEKKEISFKNEFPNAWDRINKYSTGQFYTPKGLFTFSTIYPLKINFNCNNCTLDAALATLHKDYWKIVSYTPFNKEISYFSSINIWEILFKEFFKNYYIFIITGTLALIISYLIIANKISSEEITVYATYDMMTQTFNRRAGIELLEKKFEAGKKESEYLTICFTDINDLKIVNDTLGHEKGDELIKTVVNSIKENIRESDFIIRLGGDEFLIAFPKTTYNETEEIWIKILQNISEINANESRNYLVSVSHGLAQYIPDADVTLDELIREADEKMYIEKNIIKTKNLKK
ncbi:sensor domain-containing diguanylate cyclase [Clostridium ganghwense]|uniref:Sensor domain-containing diguanylate cyclase n=1 Tax=Clostridium ganghwense TaxID=312089 RepID=A0ABT4CKC7_9CLOT|nr:sensor domain-containing diguanylate cyclase [Clostridium ganghwense]MCY6369501.1 sensor domain-containing diguanylate cyclase [Clostridium ganghwense]